MPGTFEFGEVSYTLSDLLVAAYSISGDTFSTPASMASGQTLEVESDADTDQLKGYGVTTRLLTVVRGSKLKFAAGGVDTSVMAIIGGVANYTSGLTPNQKRRTRQPAGGGGLPYFGTIGTAPTDDGGLMALGLYACKLDKTPKFTFDGKENKFNMWESEGYAIPFVISGAYYMWVTRFYETASDYTTPADGTAFKAFFTG